ncbi:GNAT family N-acetyltransferase [Mycolicibacterium bacteremicum]|uniref:GNAT family N-acetyltransferase n=1 Tax=Mycolicibacterium bacteremicum TaxID=564198 RepID=UPI0026EE9496|nr:GNAT family N-acetyltransferase [Mycolicibacterium bacteremicum]
MTDLDRAAARREITEALLKALDRRHEVLDIIVDAADRNAAVSAIAELLGTTHAGSEAVFGLSFDKLTKDSRKNIAAELEDLNSQLTFTLNERPASSAETLALRTFSGDEDRDIFGARIDDLHTAGDGRGGPAGSLDDEIAAALKRVDAEEAAWFVALEGDRKVGLVLGELVDHEVEVRIWIRPDHRKKGYGTAALRKSRSEMAIYFPAVPVVVRAPGA